MNVVCVENNFPFYCLQGVIQIIIFARGYGDRNPWGGHAILRDNRINVNWI